MKSEESILTEFELSEDLIESYTNNTDIGFLDLQVKAKIEQFPVGTLLQVTKKIGYSIKIISVKEVTGELVSAMIGKK